MFQLLKQLRLAAKIIFGLFLGFFALRLVLYHVALVTFAYSDGLRECAMMTTTQALVHGMNPYAFDLQPWYMNQYGIIYPLLVFPLAKILGVTILVHRIVTALMILGSCTIVALVLMRLRVSVLLNAWAVLMLYASLTYPGTSTPTIDPGATGTFFFLLTIFIPWFYRYSYRSLALSVVFGLIAFYTKAYVFLGAMITVSYVFFFVSKRKGLFYGGLLLVLGAISVMIVNALLPAYFDNCFFTSANMAHDWASMERLHEQIVEYKHLYAWTFVLMLFFALWYGIKAIRERSPNLKEFLFKIRIPLVLYAGCCSSLVLYFSLGRHSGAMMWYFFQLLSAFLLIGAAWLFSYSRWWVLICSPFLVINLFVITHTHNKSEFNKGLYDWHEMTQLLNQHENVLNSPLVGTILIQQGKQIVDDGQAEYFLSGGQRNYWMKGWLKEDERIYMQQAVFFESIKERLDRKDYDLIVLQPSLLPMGVGDEVRKNYKFMGQVLLYTPGDLRSYAVTIWFPKRD